MADPKIEKLSAFVQWAETHITGDEKGQAQIFLDRLFQAFGHAGSLDVGGEPEFRVRKASDDGGGTAFADYVWKPVVLIEMKKRGTVLSKRELKGRLRALYRTLELPGTNPLKDAHAALDAAVLAAYGFTPKADLLAQLLDLNQQVAARLAADNPSPPPACRYPQRNAPPTSPKTASSRREFRLQNATSFGMADHIYASWLMASNAFFASREYQIPIPMTKQTRLR